MGMRLISIATIEVLACLLASPAAPSAAWAPPKRLSWGLEPVTFQVLQEVLSPTEARPDEPDRAKNWHSIARPEQIRPAGAVHWLYLAGRGAGKTRSAAERVVERVESGEARYIALIGPTFADVRDIMVEGESGLRSVAGDRLVKYNRSLGELVFNTGARARFFSGEDPDALRGWQSTDVWGDELCAWKYAQATFDMAMFGLRLGNPEATWTTTPKNVPVLRALMAQPGCVVTRSTTYANRANLSPTFFQTIVRKYEGTTLGRQELEGQILEQTLGALWLREWFDRDGFRVSPMLFQEGRRGVFHPFDGVERVVVALDPSVSDPERRSDPNRMPDACGLVVAGTDATGCGYVIADYTAVMPPAK
jgi:phage terminase large subunit-like protein